MCINVHNSSLLYLVLDLLSGECQNLLDFGGLILEMEISPAEIEDMLLAHLDRLIIDVSVTGISSGHTWDECNSCATLGETEVVAWLGQIELKDRVDLLCFPVSRTGFSASHMPYGMIQVVPVRPPYTEIAWSFVWWIDGHELINRAAFWTHVQNLLADLQKDGPLCLIFHDNNQDIK
ncbi:hypothetical protein BDR03DRAFT_984156 [Suillus americanus]|nr:hypothetical protein BDR03DRAFT_984156 [Suillus americanus]